MLEGTSVEHLLGIQRSLLRPTLIGSEIFAVFDDLL
jgi:hypothetical protein